MVAPAPGSTPLKKPMPVPRRIGIIERRHSSRVSHRLPDMRMISDRPLSRSSRPENTSAIANRPTTTTMKPMPSCSSGRSKVKRCCPLCRSMPMVANISPRNIDSRPLASDGPVSAATEVIANSISVKYSAGPNLSAKPASGTASSDSSTTDIVPATNEAIAEIASAAPARPLRAIA